jgi:hypothetical protein
MQPLLDKDFRVLACSIFMKTAIALKIIYAEKICDHIKWMEEEL